MDINKEYLSIPEDEYKQLITDGAKLKIIKSLCESHIKSYDYDDILKIIIQGQ